MAACRFKSLLINQKKEMPFLNTLDMKILPIEKKFRT
jgi:hypothetical protein